jgi:carotenoid 1,2-hydratase
VFSPYYAAARRRGDGDPIDHCALNVALYGEGGKRWSMTERRRSHVDRAASWLTLGPSSLSWDGDRLTFRIDEVTVPFPSRIRGVVRVHPSALVGDTIALDAAGRHRWLPIAPCARVEVALDRPALRWRGAGYLDSNAGDAPLEDSFSRWDWSRAGLRHGTAILYEVSRRAGDTLSLATRFDAAGRRDDFAPPAARALPRTGWRIDRGTRADEGYAARVTRTLEDAPFYARSVLATSLLGEEAAAVHESLSLDRFRARWVQSLLAFRMPRVLR